MTLKGIKGDMALTALMKKLRGGPQSMLPMSPGKGQGVKSLKGVTPQRTRQYSAPRQNPKFTGGLNALGKTKKIK